MRPPPHFSRIQWLTLLDIKAGQFSAPISNRTLNALERRTLIRRTKTGSYLTSWGRKIASAAAFHLAATLEETRDAQANCKSKETLL